MVSLSLLWNREKFESFTPLRGFQQGDPLSLSLPVFVLRMDILSQEINAVVEKGEWKGVSISRNELILSQFYG